MGTPDTAGVFMGQFFTTAWVTVPIVGPNAIPFPLEGYLDHQSGAHSWLHGYSARNQRRGHGRRWSCTYPEPLLDCNGVVCTIPTETEFAMTWKDADMTACNYDEFATVDNGMCEYPETNMLWGIA